MHLSNICVDILALAILIMVTLGYISEKIGIRGDRSVYVSMMITGMVLLIADGVWWYLADRSAPDAALYVVYFIMLNSMFCMCVLFNMFLSFYIGRKSALVRKILKAVVILVIVTAVMATVLYRTSLFFKIQDGVYTRGPLLYAFMLVACVIFIVDAVIIWMSRRELRWKPTVALLLFCCTSLEGVIAQGMRYGLSMIAASAAFSMLIMFNMIYLERDRILHEKEMELTSQRSVIMLSQIQPHFLYNALNTIRYYCKHDPAVAEESLIGFSRYLRGNMDSLSQKAPVPFNRDLEHLKYYLAIEKLRFEDIHVSFDIKEENFFVPALTLQPLVENAIRHGLLTKMNSGNIAVSTFRKGSNYVITIADDGVGFDVNEKKNDGRAHVGIENTRYRIETMCGGTLDIISEIGVGTTVTIKIPRNARGV